MFEDIRTDIRRLIAAYEAAKAESEELKTELQLCRDRIEDYRKQISELERQIDNFRLGQAFRSSSDDAGAKEKIDGIIREIDRCIALLEG